MFTALGYYLSFISLAGQIFLGSIPSFSAAASVRSASYGLRAFMPMMMAAVPSEAPELNRRAIVRHAATISNARVEGSLWQLAGEDFSLSGNSVITEDLLVPGTPGITTGGALTFSGTIIGTGSANPSSYNIRLSGNASLRYVITRTDPVSLAPVNQPPMPEGTRDVVLTESGESFGDPETLRDLTLSGNAGEVALPPGTYGALTAGDQTAFVLGAAGSGEPSIYNLQSLSLSGTAKVLLLGPVTLNVGETVAVSGSSEIGMESSPQWLVMNIAGQSLQLSGSSKAYASANIPAGVTTVNGGSHFIGFLKSSELAVDESSLVRSADENEKVIVQHAPIISNGRIEASVWQLTGEDFSLSGNSVITGDLLAPGTPVVTTNGITSYTGIIPGSGASTPTDFNVRLSGHASLRYIMTRTDPVDLPVVEPPAAPAGTRDVSIKKSTETIGDSATLRNLRLSGNAGMVDVPPGTYGDFVASSQTAFVLGTAGSSVPAIYNLQSLSLSGGAQVKLLGPVVIHVANSVTASGNAQIGEEADSTRLILMMTGSELGVSGSSRAYAIVRAPQTDVTISGDSQLSGALVCDSLRLSGNALLRIAIDNQPPDVSAGPDQSITLPQDTVELNGTAADDGLPADVLSLSWSKISGPGSVVFSDGNSAVTTATFSSAGLYVLRLTASDGQLTGSTDVSITVIPQNLPPFADAGPDQTVTLPVAVAPVVWTTFYRN